MNTFALTFILAMSCITTSAAKPAAAALSQAQQPAALPEIPQGRAILATLRPGHPRLIALDSDIQRIRDLIKTNAEAERIYSGLLRDARKMFDAPPVEHKLIGPRLLHQSRTCLNRVTTLALAYRLTGDKRYAARAEKEMLTAAVFPDWNPKHFLDTAEMSNALGIGYDWLYAYLSPESRRTIKTAIVEKGLKPAEEIYRKKGWWAVSIHNWNQVCNGGIAAGALAIADEEPELASYILAEAARSIRLPTARLAPDGGWDEGPGYWHYAMRYAANYMTVMESALGTDFGLHDMAGFANTGMFRIHSVSPIGITFNYADAGAGGGDAAEMFYFARVFNRPLYAWYQRQQMRGREAMDLVWFDPRGTQADLEAVPTSTWFKNIDVAFMRDRWMDKDAWFVGFKGGNNGANHAHLDLGSFVLDAMGQRWAIDIGPDDYNMPGYFGAKRWSYYRLKTEGHNTLVLNGENQEPKAKAPIVAFDTGPERSVVIADLTPAYPKAAQSVRRGMALWHKQHRAVVQDEIASDAAVDVQWFMQTSAKVEIDGAAATLSQSGKQLHIRAVEPAGAKWSVEEIKLDPPQRPLKNVRRLALKHKLAAPGGRVVVEFMAKPPTGKTADVRPLAAWAAQQ